jgi:hypothetical protein
LSDHPKSLQERLRQAVMTAKQKRDAELTRCAKAIFCDEEGELKPEAKALLADMRRNSELFGSSIVKDRNGHIDRDEMLRIEGRREIVLRTINLLELGPLEVARFVEVDNGSE